MIRRIATAAFLIPVVLASVFYAPLWAYLLLIELFLLAAVWELLGLTGHFGVYAYRICYPLAAFFPLVWVYAPSGAGRYAVFAGLTVFVWSLAFSKDLAKAFLSATANLSGVLYIGVPFAVAAAYHPAFSSHGYDRIRGLELVFILVTVWASDAGAYFVGKALGRRRISPLLSPNKSLEGYLGGLFFAALAAVFFGTGMIPGPPAWKWAVAGILLGAAAIVGDLFESMLKRGAGIKDTSSLIPGHGGVLDRIDSLLFAFPVYFLLSGLLE